MGARMLIPTKNVSMTTTERDAILSPQAGWTIHNKTVGQVEEYDGTNWVGRKDLKFTDLADTIGSINSPNSLMVVDATGGLVRTQSLSRVIGPTHYSSKTLQHAKHLGVKWYWPCGEDSVPLVSAVNALDISAQHGPSAAYTYTESASILTSESDHCHSTGISSRSDTSLQFNGNEVDSNQSFTMALSIQVPASQLVSDLTDRTIFFFGTSGEIVLRNGQVAYKQSSYSYHSASLVANTPIDIIISRDGSTGELYLSVNGTRELVSGHTNVTGLMNGSFFSNAFTNYLSGYLEGVALWDRVLTKNEMSDHFRVRRNLPIGAAFDTLLAFADLTDGFEYGAGDANKALSVNGTANGLVLQSIVPANQLIEDGLRGYLAGSVPANAIVALQIQNKTMTLPVNAPKSKIYALTAPINTISFEIIKRALGAYETDIVIGSIDFVTGSSVGTITIATQSTFIAGDIICVKSPPLVEGCKDLFINLVGFSPLPLYT